MLLSLEKMSAQERNKVQSELHQAEMKRLGELIAENKRLDEIVKEIDRETKDYHDEMNKLKVQSDRDLVERRRALKDELRAIVNEERDFKQKTVEKSAGRRSVINGSKTTTRTSAARSFRRGFTSC